MVRARTKPDWFRLGIHRPRAYPSGGGRSISPGAVAQLLGVSGVELRRRFGDVLRPQEELDYIERLLKDY